jgi:hypothetical protein
VSLIYVLKCIMQDPDKHAMVTKYIETIDLKEVTYNLDNLANAQKSFEDFVFNILILPALAYLIFFLLLASLYLSFYFSFLSKYSLIISLKLILLCSSVISL